MCRRQIDHPRAVYLLLILEYSHTVQNEPHQSNENKIKKKKEKKYQPYSLMDIVHLADI